MPDLLDLGSSPFVLLDDARETGASQARLYRNPSHTIVAWSAPEVEPALARLRQLHEEGQHLAGYLAYEAGLALEPRLAPLASSLSSTGGPLLWFAAFNDVEIISGAEIAGWFADRAKSSHSWIGPLNPQLSPGAYTASFDAARAAIEAGDLYQMNLTFPLSGPWCGDPIALYAALRPSAAAGHGGLIHDGRSWLLSFSPELLFELQGGLVTARPMKGTRPRGTTDQQDLLLREELAASPKDRAENLMIVDLMRNDLARVARPGSVRVEDLFAIETYPTVHQMVSTIRADLAAGADPFDLLLALFPCGSITGAPKIRAMELIDRIETSSRGAYCGSIGYIDPTGGAAFNVAIRTLRLTPDEGGGAGRAVLGVGSAIVADSQAMPEWRECLVKGGFVRQSAEGAPARFDLIETMRFTPDEGIPLLEMHLERIKGSASELGFSFDRHAVRNAIQALCFDADQASKLRLVLARSGAYSLELAAMPAALPDPARCVLLPIPVDQGDWRLRHKTTDRAFYEAGLEVAKGAGADEALFVTDGGFVTEGCFTNVFLRRDGILLTPPAPLGLLPGVLRQSLLAEGRAREADLVIDDLTDGFFLGNALRGLIPARLQS